MVKKSDCRVLLTRSGSDNDELAATLRAKGLFVMILPCLQIVPAAQPHVWQSVLERANPTGVIVTSRYAARMLRGCWPDILHKRLIFSIGTKTAAALEQFCDVKSIVPASWNSEGLLALPAFQDVRTSEWLIIGGFNPRPLLSKTLTARGAHVEHLACYQRLCPAYSSGTIERLGIEGINTAVIYSVSAIENLANMLKKHSKNKALEMHLLLPAPRYRTIAQELGFCGKMLIMDENAGATDIAHQLSTVLNKG